MTTEIKFSDTLSIWKTYYEFKDKDKCILDSYSYIKYYNENHEHMVTDGYTYMILDEFSNVFFDKIIPKSELDNLVLFGLNSCIELHKNIYNIEYNKIYTDNWINVVRPNPIQTAYNKKDELEFHKHTTLNKLIGRITPDLTYVSYIQMPNNLSRNDAVLFVKDLDGSVYEYSPKEGECVIMKSDVGHVPNLAPQSNLDRIVMAGNISLRNEKLIKTLM